MFTYNLATLLIFIIVAYIVKKYMNSVKPTKPASTTTNTNTNTNTNEDDTLDDYISISLTNGGRITNAYGEKISYCIPKKDSAENKKGS
jgi:hypothetical protein